MNFSDLDGCRKSYPVIVLGGGISGLSAGLKLLEKNVPVIILEQAGFPGGLAGTVRQGNDCLDFGPHSFFTEDAEVSDFVHSLFNPGEFLPLARSVQFYYQGRYLDYPFTPLDLLSKMGGFETARVFVSYIKSRFRHRGQAAFNEEESSVEDWATAAFGRRLYETFFKPYTEQFWKIPARELSARCIPTHTRLGFAAALRSLFTKSINKTNPHILLREKLPTFYPRTGYGEIAKRMARLFVEKGGILHLESKITRVSLGENSASVEWVHKGETRIEKGCSVISTLPLPVVLSMLSPAPPANIMESVHQLEYRPFLFLGMVISRNHVLPCSYLYTLDRPYNRITEMNRFSSDTSSDGENILAVEIPCGWGDGLCNALAEELFELCIPALERDQILFRGEVKRLILAKSRYAYPVYRKGYMRPLKTVLDWIAKQPRIKTLGRSGEFRYMDADQCIRRAFDLAKKISAISPSETAYAN